MMKFDEERWRTLAANKPDELHSFIPQSSISELFDEIDRLTAENERLSQLLHDEMSQLEIATDLGSKRWIALNRIYEDGEKHNANWCKRKAQVVLGIK